MSEPDFAALAASLKRAKEKPFEGIVAYFRARFHGEGAIRYDRLIRELDRDDFANAAVAIPSIDDLRRADTIGGWLSEARRGNVPEVRGLLLKWLWVFDPGTFAYYEELAAKESIEKEEPNNPVDSKPPPARRPSLVNKRTKKQRATDDVTALRRETIRDSKDIFKNKLYIKELIDLLTLIASENGISTKQLANEIDRSMADRDARHIGIQSRMTRFKKRTRQDTMSYEQKRHRIDIQSPQFISKAICWLAMRQPAKVAAYYEAKGLRFVDLHPEIFHSGNGLGELS